VSLERCGRVELLRLVILHCRVSHLKSCRANATVTAYSSAIRVGRAVAATAAVWVCLRAVSFLGLPVWVSAVLLVILRHVVRLLE
jgi:hypothetical protein